MVAIQRPAAATIQGKAGWRRRRQASMAIRTRLAAYQMGMALAPNAAKRRRVLACVVSSSCQITGLTKRETAISLPVMKAAQRMVAMSRKCMGKLLWRGDSRGHGSWIGLLGY